MMKQNNQLFLRVLLATIVLSLVYTGLYPRMLLNKGGCPYETDPCGEEIGILGNIGGISGASPLTISALIIDGARYFFNSYSDQLIFLNKIEMSEVVGVNFNDLREMLYRSIENMELAKDTYTDLVKNATVTPYKLAVIERLKKLDYENFQNRNGLNGIIFKKVEHYLAKGDVTGFFCKVLVDSETILDMLYVLKEVVDKDQLPLNRDIWKLAQAYSEFHLAGQYAAQVFYEVTEIVE